MYENELECILTKATHEDKNRLKGDLKQGNPGSQWGAVAELVCLRCFLVSGCSLLKYEYKGTGVKSGKSIDFLFADHADNEFLVEVKTSTGKDTIKNVEKKINEKVTSKLSNTDKMSKPFIIFLWSLNYFGDSRLGDPNKKTELFYCGSENSEVEPIFKQDKNKNISGVLYSEINHDIQNTTNKMPLTMYRNINAQFQLDIKLLGCPWKTVFDQNHMELDNNFINISFNEKIHYK